MAASASAFQYIRNIVNGNETSHLSLSSLQKQVLNIGVVLDAVTLSDGAFSNEIAENINNVKYAVALLTKKLTKNKSSVLNLTPVHVREWIDKLIAIDYSKENDSLEVFSSCLSFIIVCMLIFETDNIDNLLSTIESKIVCLTKKNNNNSAQKRKMVDDDDYDDRYTDNAATAPDDDHHHRKRSKFY